LVTTGSIEHNSFCGASGDNYGLIKALLGFWHALLLFFFLDKKERKNQGCQSNLASGFT
jgi:hypothetical protein